jgi:hypothetical protein
MITAKKMILTVFVILFCKTMFAMNCCEENHEFVK